VQVCPTGIDIRNGLQLECIGCAACVDACDEIMGKVARPPGLVRYSSLKALNGGRTRYVRPRTIAYTVLALLGLAAFGLSLTTLKPIRVLAKRMPGAPFFTGDGVVRNQFTLRLTNKRHEAASCAIQLTEAPEGMRMIGAQEPVLVPPLGELERPVIISIPQALYTGKGPITMEVRELRAGGGSIRQTVEFLGPDPRFFQIKSMPPTP
jgi:polyferredoxin